MTHSEKAKELFEEGYNCAQSVAGAFAEEMGMDISQAALISSSFGGGIGRLREVCGCISGMALAAGYLYGYSDPDAEDEKEALYALIQELAEEFRAENGSIICRELLKGITEDSSPTPDKRTDEYYHVRPCGDLAAYAAGILEKKMEELKAGK